MAAIHCVGTWHKINVKGIMSLGFTTKFNNGGFGGKVNGQFPGRGGFSTRKI